MSLWHMSHRADPAARALADRHYNRQSVGHAQFAPPGRCLVLLNSAATAFWITSWPFAEFVQHAWGGAWICSAFRSEGVDVASLLIRSAVAATRAYFGDPPPLGLVTFVDPRRVRPTIVRSTPTFGWSFRKAGFRPVGRTKGGLHALQLLPADMPPALAAEPRSLRGLGLFDWVAG
jgi:hypothetical protein